MASYKMPNYPPVPFVEYWICMNCKHKNKIESTREELLIKNIYERKKCGSCQTEHFLSISLSGIDRCLIN